MIVAVIGTGRVGSAVVNELARNDSIDHIGIIDRDLEKSRGLWADLINAKYEYQKKLYTGPYEWVKDADIVILAAGLPQVKGQSREDLLEKNLSITTEILSKITFKPSAKLVVVTNPVDTVSINAMRVSGLPPNQVIGFGGDLDVARLKQLLALGTDKEAKSINANVIGGHGELAIPVYRNPPSWEKPLPVSINPPEQVYMTPPKDVEASITSSTRQYAKEVIERHDATTFGPAVRISELVDDIIHNRKRVHHVSYFNKEKEVFLTWPCIIGKEGVIKPIELSLTEDEKTKLGNVVAHLKEIDEKKVRPQFSEAAKKLEERLNKNRTVKVS